tara:strand:- start:254 stop:1090 length:837 start_codon:yes stop_codon:yes gene_type:complete
MLNELLEIFQTKIKALEILYVIENVKPVARIMTLDDKSVIAFCARNKLYLEEADFKIGMIDEEKEYSNKGIILDKHKQGYKVLYISKDLIKAQQAKNYENKKDHYNLGLLLGYPECCCLFFQKNSEDEENKKNDFILKIANNTTSVNNPFYTNVFTTYFDHSLISHFPHSFNCKDSINLAKKHFKIMQKHSEEISKNYIHMLECVAIYSPLGVYIIYGNMENNIITPVKILSNIKDELYNLIYNSKTIEIVDKHCIKLNKSTLRNPKLAVINFCKEEH